MLTLTLAIAQAQSGPIYFAGFILIILLAVLLLYLWIGDKTHSGALLPKNWDISNRAKKLLLPYEERFAKDIENGDEVFVQGKLSRKVQIGLKTVFWLLYLAIAVKLISEIFSSEEHWESSMILVLLIGILQSVRTAYDLYRAKRKIIQYYPPIPKQQPFFDYKGERITAKQIKDWQNIVYTWLPISLLVLALMIFITYKDLVN
ncbi:hypothetical protein [Psychrobacter pygoscelis]|uniref:hypothetical protein n=1 Tax=Psychrobacter pygoscelis TaxID=2488563 RepID=UPI00103DAE55|nr:hypothetical protein [Psychrobacter pygoscelis]